MLKKRSALKKLNKFKEQKKWTKWYTNKVVWLNYKSFGGTIVLSGSAPVSWHLVQCWTDKGMSTVFTIAQHIVYITKMCWWWSSLAKW